MLKSTFTPMKERIAGIAVSVLLAYLASVISSATGLLGTASWAILLGLFAGIIGPIRPIIESGSKWTEKHVLKWAVALLGTQISLNGVPDLGVAFLAIVIITSLIMLIGRWLLPFMGSSLKQAWLIAAGEAVCGSAAIASVSASVKARSEDSGAAILAVNAFSTIGLFFIPAILQLITFEPLGEAWWTGGYLQSAGHAIAAGFALGENSGELATTLKMARVLLLLPIMIMSSIVFGESKKTGKTSVEAKPGLFKVLPPFLWVFAFLLTLVQFYPIPQQILGHLKAGNSFLLYTALASIGLNIRISSLGKSAKTIFIPALLLTFIHLLLLAIFGVFMGIL